MTGRVTSRIVKIPGDLESKLITDFGRLGQAGDRLVGVKTMSGYRSAWRIKARTVLSRSSSSVTKLPASIRIGPIFARAASAGLTSTVPITLLETPTTRLGEFPNLSPMRKRADNSAARIPNVPGPALDVRWGWLPGLAALMATARQRSLG